MTRSPCSAIGLPTASFRHRHPVRIACILVLSALGTSAFGSTGNDPASPIHISARFDPGRHETRVQGAVANDACMSFRLTDEWKVLRAHEAAYTLAAASGAEIEVRVRPAGELQGLPQEDMAARDAAALQRSYEELVGKPAQAVSHEPTAFPGVSRWSATWIDANAEEPDHALKMETFIVATKGGSALELTITNAGSPEAYGAQVDRLLSSLRVVTGSDCQHRLFAAW